jgi:hypothetical protein
VLPRRERIWSWLVVLAFLAFCAMNVYSLLQFNTGFRYLLPVVPFLFLFASDHLARLGRKWLAALTIFTVAHSAALCMTREVNDTEFQVRFAAVQLGVAETELPGYWTVMSTLTPVPQAWHRVLHEGVQLPWLTVLRQTSHDPRLEGPLPALAALALAALACVFVWRIGAREARKLADGTRTAALAAE